MKKQFFIANSRFGPAVCHQVTVVCKLRVQREGWGGRMNTKIWFIVSIIVTIKELSNLMREGKDKRGVGESYAILSGHICGSKCWINVQNYFS